MLEIVVGRMRFAYSLEGDRFEGDDPMATAYVNAVYRGARLDPMEYYPDRITARIELAATELRGAVVGALPPLEDDAGDADELVY